MARFGGAHYGDDVELGLVVGAIAAQDGLGSTNDALHFLFIDCIQSLVEAVCAGLDLDKDHAWPFCRDDVDLFMANVHITIHDGIAQADEIVASNLFAPLTEIIVLRHDQ